ncbi:hypothetical protein Tco_0948027, partial [Tanacetum coccineum]
IRAWRYQEGSPSTFELGESSSAAHVLLVTNEPVHHIISLLLARLVRHEDQIEEIRDHLEEIPLERVETVKQKLKTLRDRAEAAEK